ncbi:MAG: molybdopterin biosynthesis protein [Thermoplasmatales archaeon]
MKVFHKLVEPDVARRIVREEISRLIGTEVRKIQDSCGYISGEDIYARMDVPPFDRSEVDGYAVFHKSVEGAEEDAPAMLDIIGEIKVGELPNVEIMEGEAAYISTGAMIPRGADSVVMVEDTKREGDKVEIYKACRPGENIAHSGSDFFTGEVLSSKGSIISPETISLLASSGISSIKVVRKLNIGIISTGNELVEPGLGLGQGMIYDTNSYFFKAALEDIGLAECELLGVVKDDYETMYSTVSQHISRYDILISSGSTSAGFHDLMYKIVEDLGGKLRFHGIAMKPGKPTFLASFDRSVFLGMPGFPLSSASVLRYIIIPAIVDEYGLKSGKRRYVKIPFRMNTERGKVTVIPAIIARNGNAYPVYGESGSVSRLYYADGFIVLGSKKTFYDKGEKVGFFDFGKRRGEILFIGSNDPLIERIIYDVSKAPKIINAGSWGGVEAMRIGLADVSGVHLIKDGVYNRFLMDDETSGQFYLVRGFSRSQGIISSVGISSFKEILDGNLLFVNRNKGSGTRDLIEAQISADLGDNFEREKIRGYLWEAKSHAAVALAVAQGRADAGVSIEFYAKKFGLRFHKIRDEDYDILISKEFFSTPLGRNFITSLKNASNYKNEFPGYIIPENIGKVVG